ncbi:hypothetical protein Kisp01_21470 [Kineosporia sp. NBRC 101677]|uniref:hypothetical protein n=1 Tax=Kineosporia sp. NBRC 101677 TaxID=3032197 RepID=UPI0024A2FC48|nr:hypothetical protein [Kineosporia sp. NBRC 101677]GLY15132.1 hypothetical protein Kisp01_21470 [Kineosporia sp. NBRC 101677]
MLSAWPLLLRAPGRMLRSGSTAAMIAVSVALLAALVAAGPLFGRATASGSLERKLATVPANTQLVREPALGVVVAGGFPAEAEAKVTQMVDGVPWLGGPVTAVWASGWQYEFGTPTPFLAVDGKRREAVLYHRTGAVEALDVVQGERGAKGIWLPEGVASDLGLRPGDEFWSGKTFQGTDIQGCDQVGAYVDKADLPAGTPVTSRSKVRLAGTYRTGPDGRLPAGSYFSSIAARLPSDPLGCPTPALLMIGDRDTVNAALQAARETPTWTRSAALTEAGRVPERLEQAAAAAQELKVAGADPGSELTRLLTSAGAIARVETGLPDLQAQAEKDALTASQQGRGIAFAGAALGLAAVVTALRALAQRRRRENELLAGLGTPLPLVVAAGVLELLLPAVVGAAAGGAGAWLAFETFGPQRDLGPGAVTTTALAAGLVALVTLLGNAVVGLLQARSINRALAGHESSSNSGPRGSGRSKGPWLGLLTGATVCAVIATVARDGGASYTDPLSAVLPILVLACGSLLVVRVGTWLFGMFSGRRSRTSANALVLRGLRDTGVPVADLVVVLALGVGVLAYGLVSATSVHASALDKASVLAGAESTAQIQHSYDLGAGEGADPDLGEGLSLVWRARAQLQPDYVDVDVLVVNARTLPSVAAWGQGPELAEARSALGLFGEAKVGDPLPALLVGLPDWDSGAGGTIQVGADQIQLTARAGLTTFPGTDRPTVVFDAAQLFASLDARNRNLDPSVKGISEGQGSYATWLWSTRSADSLGQYLEELGVTARSVTSMDQARATPVLTSSGWAATYQIVLGLAALALAGLSLLVAVDRRVARAAPVDLVLRRFGVRPARLVRLRASELALTCLAALAVLVAPLALVLVLLPRLVEPGPELSPAMGVQVPLIPLLTSALAAALVTLLAVVVAARRSATLEPAEVLRDDQ